MIATVLSWIACSAWLVPTPADVPRSLTFVENRGQLDERVCYSVQSGSLTGFFTEDALVLTVRREGERAGDVADGVHLRLAFEDGNDGVRLEGEGEPVGGWSSYRGRDPARWIEGAPTFAAIRYSGLYDGVDVRVAERDGLVAYDLLLDAGARPDRVVVRCDGATALAIDAEGRLVMDTDVGPVVQTPPVAWQVAADGERLPVEARFRLLDEHRFGFTVPELDADRPLVIDPGLSYGTYLGGSLRDRALAVAVASDGDVILAGTTQSSDFPTTVGAFQENIVGLTDAFVARVDPSTGNVDFATLLGGTDNFLLVTEQVSDVALGDDGSIYLTGRANSTDFPTTTGAFAEMSAGGEDAFVTKLSSAGAMQWSTYVGGSKNDEAFAIAVDGSGRAHVGGHTFSDDFPTTTGAFDETFNSIFFSDDGFLVRVAADGSSLEYATYVGGVFRDQVRGLALDGTGAVTAVGLTGSNDFPATPGAYEEDFLGFSGTETDAFVCRLSAAGDSLTWATYFGGFDLVEAQDVALDAAGNAVFCGLTQTRDLPTTAGAAQVRHGGGTGDGFAAKVSSDGSTLVWSTFLGGAGEDEAHGVALNGGDQPTIVGTTSSRNFVANVAAGDHVDDGGGSPGATAPGASFGQGPSLTPDPLDDAVSDPPRDDVDGTLDGGQDAFLVRLDDDGSGLRFGTLYGGSDVEEGLALALDGFTGVYVVGQTDSDDLPTPGTSVDSSSNGSGDAFLARFGIPPVGDLATGLPGHEGRAPRLRVAGLFDGAESFAIDLCDARPDAKVHLVLGAGRGAEPLRGGVLAVDPVTAVLTATTDGDGSWSLTGVWPDRLPWGATLALQAWVVDPDGPEGFAASNGITVRLR